MANGCLDEKLLSSYLDERLPDIERKRIEEHIAVCNNCLDLLVVAYESQGKKCPEALRQRIKNRLGLRQKRKRPEVKWLIAAIVFFALSFVFRQYFLQFLAGAIILGFKWVMEGEGERRIVMIFKGMTDKGPEVYKNRMGQFKKYESS